MPAWNHYMRIQLTLCFFGLLLASECAPKPLAAATPPATQKLRNPSDEECKAFAAALLKALESGDLSAYGRLFDYDTMLERAVGDIADAPQSKKGFIRGVKKDLTDETGMPSMLHALIKEGGSIRLLRIHEQDGQKRALIRLLPAKGGAMYFDYLLAKAFGNVRAVDIFVYTSGEMLSATIRQSFLPLAVEESKSLIQRLMGEEGEFMKNFDKIMQMKNAILAKEYQKAWKSYEAMPAELRKNKTILTFALQASQNVGATEYQNVLDTYKASHPDDPCLDLMLIDYYFIKKEYDEAAASAIRVDKKLGGDAHMKTICARMLLAQDKDDEARKIAQEAIDLEGDFLPAYKILLGLSFKTKDFDESVRILDRLSEKFGNRYRNLTKTPENAEFLASPQYREWKEK